MKKENIEMTAGTTIQEEIKMKKENIEEAKKIISEELLYILESCYYIEEKGYDRLKELRVIGEILRKGIERIYDARVERGVAEEELGRKIDREMFLLYKKSFYIDREIEKHEAALA